MGHSSLYFVCFVSKVSFVSQKTTKEGFVGLDDISISAGTTVLTILNFIAKDIFLLQQRTAEGIIFDTAQYSFH